MRRHPNADELETRITACMDRARPWEGIFYRACTIEYSARRDVLSGVGSRIAGGRWNSPGLFRAVYGSLEPETAMAESLASYRDFNIPLTNAMPLVFVAASAKLQCVLDLTSIEVQKSLSVTLRAMNVDNWRASQWNGQESLTQAIGRLAWKASFEAILVPSARIAKAINLVLFPTRRRKRSMWKIHRANKLPKRDY